MDDPEPDLGRAGSERIGTPWRHGVRVERGTDGAGRIAAAWRWTQARIFQENAQRTLETGVTTVRDLGPRHNNDIAMRDLINSGRMTGPRMFVCGTPLHITYASGMPHLDFPYPGLADGVPAVLRVVRQEVFGAGADWVKMFSSTGTGADVSTRQTVTFEEMKAAADAAHALGAGIAIHSYGPEGARDAVRAGANSIEHAVDIGDATLAEMVKRGTFYVPTVDHNR